MCGLVALFHRSAPVDPARVRRALDVQRHRGPDGEGLWRAADGTVALGHVRLAVVDLAGGAQPLASEDGQVVAVVNGELYDDDRLRAELIARGHRFHSRSDSELLVHLYEEEGEACVERLRGELAFVLWDARRRVLVAGRDRFGIKPLVWAETANGVAFASEAKALFALGVRPAWDHASVWQAACAQYVLPDRTLFAGVRQVRPGHLLVVDAAGARERRYWDLDLPAVRPPAPADPTPLVATLGEALEEAVRLRLRGDVPVACHLSGGLDSSAVLGLARRHAPVEAFTVAFDDPAYDERQVAAASAAHAGAPLHVVEVSTAALVDALPDAVEKSEGLAINAHLPAKLLLSRAVQRAGFKVVLTGEGADELLLGYAHLRHDLAVAAGVDAQAALQRLAGTNRASAGLMLPDRAGLPTDAVRAALGFVPSWIAAKAALGARLHTLLDPTFVAAADGDAFARLIDALPADQLARRHPVDQAAYAWTRLALANYILRTLGDGTEMASSVEGRLPFLDHEVAAVARRLPLSLLIRDGVEKWALREAVRPVVTPEVARREKHPFLAPPLGAALRDLLVDGRVPFFDRRALAAIVDRLPTLPPAERTALEPVLFTAASLRLLGERLHLES